MGRHLDQNTMASRALSATFLSSLSVHHSSFSVIAKGNHFSFAHSCIPATGPLHWLSSLPEILCLLNSSSFFRSQLALVPQGSHP